MKSAITYTVFFLATLVATVGLITTIEQYPNFALIFATILGAVLGIMGVIRFLDDRRIK